MKCEKIWEWLNYRDNYITDLTSSEKQYPNCYPNHTGPEEMQTSSPLENIIFGIITTGVLVGVPLGIYCLCSNCHLLK